MSEKDKTTKTSIEVNTQDLKKIKSYGYTLVGFVRTKMGEEIEKREKAEWKAK